MPKPDPEMPDPELIDDDLPELDDDFFARARPAAEVMPAEILAALRRPRGRPRIEEPKQTVSLRLDAPVLRHLRASGRGWHTAVNRALAGLIADGKL